MSNRSETSYIGGYKTSASRVKRRSVLGRSFVYYGGLREVAFVGKRWQVAVGFRRSSVKIEVERMPA